jgi:hypothetical protein
MTKYYVTPGRFRPLGFGTLALKGAIEESSTPHCEPGCIWCEINANWVLTDWLKQVVLEGV